MLLIFLESRQKRRRFHIVQYNDGTWEVVSNRPRVEVKAVRIDQYLIGIREPQMIDDFYVFVESDLSPDYLTTIFEEDVFNDDFLQKLKMDDIFIKSDKNSSIINPVLPKRAEVVGSFRLIGTYTKDQIRNNTVSCGPKISPRYVKAVENVPAVRGENLNEKLNIIDGKFTYSYEDSIYLPMSITGDTESLVMVKANKGSVYLKTRTALVINGDEVGAGYIKIDLSSFDRSSNWDENLAIKKSFEIFTNDSTEEMLASFDQVYKSNL